MLYIYIMLLYILYYVIIYIYIVCYVIMCNARLIKQNKTKGVYGFIGIKREARSTRNPESLEKCESPIII